MRILLDTHAFLWFIFADRQLSKAAERISGDPGNERLLSIASVRQIVIKNNTGKLVLPSPLDHFINDQLKKNRVRLLPIKFNHAVNVHSLPYACYPNGAEHKDPFDRLIVSQALIEKLPLVSIDVVFGQYGVDVHW